MRIAFADLETSGLDADGWNTLLCGAIAEYQPTLWRAGKLVKPPWTNIRVFRRENYNDELWDDKQIAKAIYKAISEYDIVVSWNGIRFDETFLTTRLREYGIHTKKWPKHKDLMYTAKHKLRVSSAALDNIARLLNIHEVYGVKKTHLIRRRWRMAIRGHKPSYNYVVNHCAEDIKVTAACWEELKDLVTEIK